MKPSKPAASEPERPDHDRIAFEREIRDQSKRKIQARKEGDRSIWMGLGVFGMVGWSVMLPTLLGIALGIWIDKRFPSQYSWTLMGLFIGVMLGCWNAWYWIQREQER